MPFHTWFVILLLIGARRELIFCQSQTNQTTDVCAPYLAELGSCLSGNLAEEGAAQECFACMGAGFPNNYQNCAELRVIQCTTINDCTVCHPCYAGLEDYWDCYWQVDRNCSTNCQGLFSAPPSPVPIDRACLSEETSTNECFLTVFKLYSACDDCIDEWTNQFEECNQYLDLFCYALHEKCVAMCEPCERQLETQYTCWAQAITVDPTYCTAQCPDIDSNPTISVNPAPSSENAGAPSTSPVVPTTITNPMGGVGRPPGGANLTPSVGPINIPTSAARAVKRFVWGILGCGLV